MQAADAELQPAPSTPPANPVARLTELRALVRLYDTRLRALLGMKLAKLWGAGIAVGYGAAMIVLATGSASETLDAVVIRAVAWLSWIVAGSAGYVAARHWQRLQHADGVDALVRQRGYSTDASGRALRIAVARRIGLLVGIPALAMAGLTVALARTTPELLSRLILALGIGAYAVVIAIVLAWVTDWSARLSARHGGAIFLALGLVPHWTREVWPSTPSIPAMFDWLRDELFTISVAVL